MAHFAEVKDGVVLRVLVTDSNDPTGDEGYQWLVDNLGGAWIKTSYNSKIRKHFAGAGYTYDAELDAFIAPKCHEGAILDEATCTWTCGDASHEAPSL